MQLVDVIVGAAGVSVEDAFASSAEASVLALPVSVFTAAASWVKMQVVNSEISYTYVIFVFYFIDVKVFLEIIVLILFVNKESRVFNRKGYKLSEIKFN